VAAAAAAAAAFVTGKAPAKLYRQGSSLILQTHASCQYQFVVSAGRLQLGALSILDVCIAYMLCMHACVPCTGGISCSLVVCCRNPPCM
jgi:hypothetical protein